MAKTKNYRLAEYPEPKNILELLMARYKRTSGMKAAVKEELGEDGYRSWITLKKIKREQEENFPCSLLNKNQLLSSEQMLND